MSVTSVLRTMNEFDDAPAPTERASAFDWAQWCDETGHVWADIARFLLTRFDAAATIRALVAINVPLGLAHDLVRDAGGLEDPHDDDPTACVTELLAAVRLAGGNLDNTRASVMTTVRAVGEVLDAGLLRVDELRDQLIDCGVAGEDAEQYMWTLDRHRLHNGWGEEHTDLGNARRLVARHGVNVRYVHGWKKWLVWDGTRWRIDDSGEIVRLAKETAESIARETGPIAEHVVRLDAQADHLPDGPQKDVLVDQAKELGKQADAIFKWARASQSKKKIDDAIALAASEPGVPIAPEELDANGWLLNCANGTIDLRSSMLRPARREDLTTKLVAVNYDPAATAPTWTAFLDRVMDGSRDLVDYLSRISGYALTGDTSEHVVFFAYGTGANGKSTFIEAIRACAGDYSKQTDFSTLLKRDGNAIRNDIARLHGARLVTASEAESGAKMAEVVVKQLTGGDTVTARFLYAEHFEFVPDFKLMLVTNHLPEVSSIDEATWRRIRVIPFTVTIPKPERDKHLGERLAAERPGILAWMVAGCLRWQEIGLDQPDEVSAATESYRADQDVLGPFLDDRCQINPLAKVPAGELYNAYVAYSAMFAEEPMSQRAFGMRLKERGFVQVRTGKTRYWTGLKLLDPAARGQQFGEERDRRDA